MEVAAVRASKAQLAIVAVLMVVLAGSLYMLLFRKPAAAPAKTAVTPASADAKGTQREPAKAARPPGEARKATAPATAEKPAPTASAQGTPSAPVTKTDEKCPPGVQPGLWAAWGTYSKQRPSQAAAASAPGTELAAIAEGTSYTGMDPDEIDKARQAEKAGPLPDGRAFRLRQGPSPFKRPSVTQLAALRGQAPSGEAPPASERAETATAQTPPATASAGAEKPATAAAPSAPPSAPPAAIASGLPPAIGATAPGVPLPDVGAPATVQPQPQRPAFLGGQGFPQATTGPRSGAKPALNLRVTGTVVASDGRSSAVITDGTNTFYVRAGQTFRAGGREFRVVSVTQGAVEVENQQRRLTLGIGGAAP